MTELTSGRITTSESADGLVKLFKQCPFIIVKELGKDGDNPHYHFGLVGKPKSRAALRIAIKREYGMSGNAQLSLKDPVTGNGSWQHCKQYLCKGENGNPPNVIASQGLEFSDAMIREYHELSNDHVHELKKKVNCSRMFLLTEAVGGERRLPQIISIFSRVYKSHGWPYALHEVEAKVRIIYMQNSEQATTDVENQVLSKFGYNSQSCFPE